MPQTVFYGVLAILVNFVVYIFGRVIVLRAQFICLCTQEKRLNSFWCIDIYHDTSMTESCDLSWGHVWVFQTSFLFKCSLSKETDFFQLSIYWKYTKFYEIEFLAETPHFSLIFTISEQDTRTEEKY